MTDFRSPSEEVARLLAEIRETRASLQLIASSLNGIERHIRRAFQVPKPPRVRKMPSHREVGNAVDSAELLSRFDLLRMEYVQSDSGAFNEALHQFSDSDLRALAKELGLSGAGKASVFKLNDWITQRVRESALLSGSSMLRGSEERTRELPPSNLSHAAANSADAVDRDEKKPPS